MAIKDKICVALDVDTAEKAIVLADRLAEYVGVFKVGMQLFSSEGPKIVELIGKRGGKVFLDLKYHDIPNTVVSASIAITRLGVYMFNIHTTGGYEMMAQTAEAVYKEAEKLKLTKPVVLGVTVLTSINQLILTDDLKVTLPIGEYVLHLAQLAKRAGLDGVVASPEEVSLIKESLGAQFVVLTPGIRPLWSVGKDDQKRVTTPSEAIKKGSDYIVIGRPIIAADNPANAAKKIYDEISQVSP